MVEKTPVPPSIDLSWVTTEPETKSPRWAFWVLGALGVAVFGTLFTVFGYVLTVGMGWCS